MKRLLISTASLAIFAALPAFAQQAPTPDVVGDTNAGVEQIVVAATRTPQPLDRIGSSITVITEEEIRARQAVVVSDLLSRTPGVTFSRNGNVGGSTSVRIRGAESDQTAVVIDGVKLNDPSSTGGGFNFANLLIGDVQRIEVLRGAQSTLWGSQAMGGVVNIVTVTPNAPFQVSVTAEGGSHGTATGRVGIGGKSDHLMWRLAGDYYTTDGHAAFINGPEDDGYQHVGASGRVLYEITDGVSTELRAVYSRGHNQFDGSPPPAFTLIDTLEYGITKEFIGYGGVNFALLGGRLRNRVAYGYTETNRDNFNPDQAVTPVTFDAAGKNKRFEYQGTFAVAEEWDAVFGAEHETSSFRTASPTGTMPDPVPAVAEVSITSGYTQVQGEILSGLTLTGGLRYDSHDTFGDRALGQAAAAWSLNEGDTVIRASFGQGFKAPTLFQLFSNFGNTNLKPEQADSFDGGIEQRLFDGLVSVSATGFYRNTTNQIDFVSCPSSPVCAPGQTGSYDNIARGRAQGVELTGAVAMDRLTFAANYTYTDTENTSPGSANRGKALPRRAKHTANISASYDWPWDVSTGVDVQYVGDSFDNAANTFVLKDHVVVGLRAAWQVNETVELYGRIENLFDEVYSTIRNYGSPRRGAVAGIRARF